MTDSIQNGIFKMFIKKEKKNVYHVSKSLNGWFVLFYTLTRKKFSDTRKNSEISEHLGSLILILFWFNWIKNKNNMHTYKKEENIKKKWCNIKWCNINGVI